MGKCCGQGGSPKEAQGQAASASRRLSDSHDEEVCHGTGERRRDLLEQLKIFLNEFDDKPCTVSPPQAGGPGAVKPLGQYPDYMRKHHQSWMPANPSPPLITSVGAHEIRPTEDYEKKSQDNNEYITYVDARSKPPPPSCDCAKRNGLQDQCTRYECSPPTPQCLATNPGPCCPPSMGLTGREAAQQAAPRPGPKGRKRESFSTTNEDYGSHYGREADTRGQQWTTTHRQDDGQGQGQGQGRQEMMVCSCRADPGAMPSGQKYICCPIPPSGQ